MSPWRHAWRGMGRWRWLCAALLVVWAGILGLRLLNGP